MKRNKTKQIIVTSLIIIVVIVVLGLNSISIIPTIAVQVDEVKITEGSGTAIDGINCIDPECIEEIPLTTEILKLLEITESEPITSVDDVVTQIIDEITTTNQLSLGISRIYTHEDGTIEQSEASTQGLFLQSFITEVDSFRNLIPSLMEIQIEINTDKQILDGRLSLAYLVDGETNNLFKTTHVFKGVPQDGKFVIKTKGFNVGEMFKSLTSITSISTIEVVMTEAFVFLEGQEQFAITEPVIIYTVEVERDIDKIISVTESSEFVKIFPTDDSLRICSAWADVRYGKAQCYSSTGGYCNAFRLPILSYTDAPAIGAIVVKDSSGGIITSTEPVPSRDKIDGIQPRSDRLIIPIIKTVCPLDIQIQRTGNYTVQITSPQNDQFTFETPRSQKNFVWTCAGNNPCNYPSDN